MSGAATRVAIWGGAVAVAGFLAWANWAEIDEITRATGQVIATSRNQVVQVPDGGVLAEMLVQEGAAVKRGQLLAHFDRTRAEAGYLEGAARAAGLQAAVARLRAEVFGGDIKFPPELDGYPEFRSSQLTLFARRQAAMQEEIGAVERSLALTREEYEINQRLFRAGDISRAEVLRLERQVNELEAQITNRRNRFLQDSQAELVKAQEELAGVQQVVAQRRDSLSQTEIRAPMDGIVRNVRLTTIGGVAKPGEELLQIVPVDDDLIVEARARTADIAFLRPGLPASVKLDAYDYTIYGILRGEVSYISPDTLTEDLRGNEQPYYRVHVKIAAPSLEGPKGRISVQPGMTAVVEILTGRRTLLAYLTKPITTTVRESLGER